MRLVWIAGLMFALSCAAVVTESDEDDGFATASADQPIAQALASAVCTQNHAFKAKNTIRDWYGSKHECTWPGGGDYGTCANHGFYMEIYLKSRYADGFAMFDVEGCMAGLDCWPQWNIWRCSCPPNLSHMRCEQIK